MTLTLKRSSLVAQVADAIRGEILRHAWPEWIPSERELSATLHVSRNTCRRALQVLRHEELVRSVHGRGICVNRSAVRQARSATKQLRSVGIMIPEPMGRLRPQLSLSIDLLRDELFDLDVRVQLHPGPSYYQANPQRALEQLVKKSRHDCWILYLSHEPLQRWFMKRGIPCVVSGSVYPGIRLPSVDLHYRAVCRHAAGKLIALGHRRLVFFNRHSRAAGDLESEAGFAEGVRASSHTGVDAQVVYHNDSRDTVTHLVQQLYAGPKPPTGLLIANSYCYLAVAGALARRGFRIPEDVSLICREDDSFLDYVEPAPAHYLDLPAAHVRKAMVLIRSQLEVGTASLEPVRISPRFIAGGSCRQVSGD